MTIVLAAVFFAEAGFCQKSENAVPELIKSADNGKLYRLDGIQLLVLSGTFREMGRQYGALMGEQISRFYEAAVRKTFIEGGYFTEQELDAFFLHVFKTLPKRQKDLLLGMAETSGLKLEKLVCTGFPMTIQILARKKWGGSVNACTSVAAWGRYTADGKTLTARDFDFPDQVRALAKDFLTVVIFKPSDGSNGLTGIGLAGSICFIDAVNDHGLYVEINNAADSAGLVIFTGRTDVTAQIANLLFDADDAEELDLLINSLKTSYGIILMAADSASGRYYEWSGWDLHKRTSEDSIIAAANQFRDPSWNVLSYPSPAAWYSSVRETNLLNLVKNKSTVRGPKHMMSSLDVPLYNEDGSLGKGVAVLEQNPKDHEVTVWQVVTQPGTLKLWLRMPTLTDWVQIDLKDWFKR